LLPALTGSFSEDAIAQTCEQVETLQLQERLHIGKKKRIQEELVRVPDFAALYSDLTQEVTGSRITASFSPWVAVVSMILSFLTVCLAASGPARQMGKLRPIEAVKESWSNPSLKKSAKHPILKKCFGFLGNISANSMTANKRLFRTCNGKVNGAVYTLRKTHRIQSR